MAKRKRELLVLAILTELILGIGCDDQPLESEEVAPGPPETWDASAADGDSATDTDSDSDTDSDTDADSASDTDAAPSADSDSDSDTDSDTDADSEADTDSAESSSTDAGPDAAVDGDGSVDAGFATALYATSFEEGEPEFEKVMGAGTFSTDPPPGTYARTGERVITNSSITTDYDGRVIRSVDCIPLLNDIDPVVATAHAQASTANGGNQVRARFKMVWYAAEDCEWPIGIKGTAGPSVVLPQGEYTTLLFDHEPLASATHFRIELEIRDDNGEPNDEDDWAADDVSVSQ